MFHDSSRLCITHKMYHIICMYMLTGHLVQGAITISRLHQSLCYESLYFTLPVLFFICLQLHFIALNLWIESEIYSTFCVFLKRRNTHFWFVSCSLSELLTSLICGFSCSYKNKIEFPNWDTKWISFKNFSNLLVKSRQNWKLISFAIRNNKKCIEKEIKVNLVKKNCIGSRQNIIIILN